MFVAIRNCFIDVRKFFTVALPFAIVSMPAAPHAALSQKFQPGCQRLPFPVATQRRPIDDICSKAGNSAPGSPKGLQNTAKNNLCATKAPVILTIADFSSLQEQATQLRVPFGATFVNGVRVEHLPTDRSILSSGRFRTVSGRSVGEGNVVQIVGLMDDPHPADVGSGEDVNCAQKTAPGNDVHINLTEVPIPPPVKKNDPDKEAKLTARNAALCDAKTVVVEIIPHFRPDAYEPQNLVPLAQQHVPVRISGQLFFDAAHRPCHGSVPGDSSVRGSLWEIHPIYSVEVCKHKTLAQCPATAKNVWLPVHTALAAHSLRAASPSEIDEIEREGEHEGE